MRKYHSPNDYVQAAHSPETSTEELRYLATSQYSFVRAEVARNPKTEADVLISLMPTKLDGDANLSLALAIISNAHVPLVALKALAKQMIHIPNFEPRNFYHNQ